MELPLFVLNTVLFPRMVLPLHVFEERYKEMIEGCLETRSPFGVVLIKSGQEVGGPAQPHSVGTTAHIVRVERLEDGRMNLMAVGRERFRVLGHRHDRPYLVAKIRKWPSEIGDEYTVDEHGERVTSLFAEYFRLLSALADQWSRSISLPGDLEQLADFVAARMDVPPPAKQELLEAPTVSARLEREAVLLGDEIVKLQAQVTAHRRERYGGLGAVN